MADPNTHVAKSDPAITRHRLDLIDGGICHYRALYLKAIWVGHDGEAEAYEGEVDHLLDVRAICERGLLTAAQAREVDAL